MRVVAAVDLHVAQFFLHMGAGHLQARHAVDDINGEAEPIDLVFDSQFQWRVDIALFLVATYMQIVVIGAAIRQPVDQPGISVEIENDRLDNILNEDGIGDDSDKEPSPKPATLEKPTNVKPINVDKKEMGRMRMLDLGANVDCQAEHLFQFGVMGSILAEAVDGVSNPRVGLLNIGQEAIKGSDSVKRAAQLFENSQLNYVGFIEGTNLYQGDADVVVCDGFVGNVSLKTSEGVAKMISHFMKASFKRNIFTKIAALIASPVLRALKNKFDPRRYNGASFVGLQGIVIKSHGGADVFAFANAIKEAVIEVDHAVPERIKSQLEHLLINRQAS